MNIKAVACCALMVAAGPAAAGPYGAYGPGFYGAGPYGPGSYETRAYPLVSTYEVDAVLRAHGLRPITQPVQTGRYVVVRAVDSNGEIVRVLMNAHFGNIVQIVPLPPAPVIGERLPYESYPSQPLPAPRYGAVRPDLKVEPSAPSGPDVPYAVPNPRPFSGTPPSAAPTASDPYAPVARTPMPRPRPAVPAATAAIKPAPEKPDVPGGARAPQPAPHATTGTASTPPGTASPFPPPAPLE